MRYKQPSLSSAVRFEKAPISGIEFSRMSVNPRVYTTYNAGDIVPVYYEEVLPHSTFSVDVDFVNRLLSATLKPTMGSMQIDLFAFFVPNRVVNESWKNVQGENTSGYWSAPEVQLAPLYPMTDAVQDSVQIPIGSIADYYGLPTQKVIPKAILSQMNDLKYRGYLEIVNNFFRDQNYQPPYSYSKLNVYNGFLQPFHSFIELDGERMAGTGTEITTGDISDGSYANGAIAKALYGEGNGPAGRSVITGRVSNWSALDKPIKANKLHDYFTSGLPSPQKGPEVYFGIAESAPVVSESEVHNMGLPINLGSYSTTGGTPQKVLGISGLGQLEAGQLTDSNQQLVGEFDSSSSFAVPVTKSNLIADLSSATGVSINDLRIAAATQQVYEILARGGSRYLEVLRNMFGIEADNPFKDIPTQLGHMRRELDLYQVAQTSNSVDGETPQGNLAGFGYTSNGGNMFTYTALEHGYIHFLAVVRHRNIYSTYCAPDNFRMNTLDWYQPPLANIGEQPLKRALLNPFDADSLENSIAFQEAWAEYRYSPDRVSGYCRTGLPVSLSGKLDIWTYADPYDEFFTHVNGDWLRSNSQEVLDRTLAVTSEVSPQFIAMFEFKITKQLPMPIYSVPGLDVL